MSSTTDYRMNAPVREGSNGHRIGRSFTETKSFIKTSEFIVWLLSVAAILVVTYQSGANTLSSWHGWLLVAVLSSAYMFSRGIAKAGSREAYSYDDDNR